MSNHNKINYIEIQVKDVKKTKDFFTKVFNWEFTDYGEDYTCFTNGGIDGGFYTSEKSFLVKDGSPLLVLYSENLEKTQKDINNNGGDIIKPIYSFPGGRRFHFTDVNGNEYSVWSE